MINWFIRLFEWLNCIPQIIMFKFFKVVARSVPRCMQ